MEDYSMKIETLKLVYFSPTGTTKTVVENIGAAIEVPKTVHIDITQPASRLQLLETSPSDLLIVGVPVYMGRVPDLVSGWLKSIFACNTIAVAVVVYGNRAYENALLELNDILITCGCHTIAEGAFVGEHSFSGSELPCSVGRPDYYDISDARNFGSKINDLLHSAMTADEINSPQIPGIFPYGGLTKLWDIDFIAVNDECTQCGLCADICPAGAVDWADSRMIDIVKCITCCACIKKCPKNARSMKPGLVRDAAVRISTLYKERKQPEIFINNHF